MRTVFPALIADWRAKFDLPDLPFFFVQLAAYGWHDYTHLRQAQTAALQLPGVAMATAIDLGDMKSPEGGIHPRLKQEVRTYACIARLAWVFWSCFLSSMPPPARAASTIGLLYVPLLSPLPCHWHFLALSFWSILYLRVPDASAT